MTKVDVNVKDFAPEVNMQFIVDENMQELTHRMQKVISNTGSTLDCR
jgi:predicted ATPase with chaperone activity